MWSLLNSSTKMTNAQVSYACSEVQFQWETTYLDKQVPASTYSCYSLAELLHDLTVFTYKHLSQHTTYHLPYIACTLKPTPTHVLHNTEEGRGPKPSQLILCPIYILSVVTHTHEHTHTLTYVHEHMRTHIHMHIHVLIHN